MEVEKSPPRKIRKITPSSEKLYVFCTCATGSPDDAFQIFIVDLDADAANSEPTFKDPALIINRKCLNVLTFCVLDSTLYLFGTKEGYTYEFPPNVSGFPGKRLERHDLRRIRDMNCEKGNPVAIPTPDKKYILVFSVIIARDRSYDYDYKPSDSCDFELYDPCTDMWSRLPNMPLQWRLNSHDITGYSFINDHTILLQAKGYGAFTLNLSPPNDWHRLPQPWGRPRPKDWSDVDVAETPLSCPVGLVGRSIYIEDSFILDEIHAVDKSYAFDYPNLPCLHDNIVDRCNCVALLDAGPREWKFCVAFTGVDSEGKHPRLIVNVYLFDLAKYKEAKKMMIEQGTMKVGLSQGPLPGTETLKSFKFSLEPQIWPDCFFAVALFPSR